MHACRRREVYASLQEKRGGVDLQGKGVGVPVDTPLFVLLEDLQQLNLKEVVNTVPLLVCGASIKRSRNVRPAEQDQNKRPHLIHVF